MYYTGDYEAETLPLLRKEYIDNNDEPVFTDNIGCIYYLSEAGIETQLPECALNEFVEEVNACLEYDKQEAADQREHEQSERF